MTDILGIDLAEGKYTYLKDEQGQRALRYGEPWRDLIGDNFVLAMATVIEEQRGCLEAAEARILELNAALHKTIANRVTWQTRWEATDKALGEALVKVKTMEDGA